MEVVILENKAVTKERKFTKALREQFRTLATAWNKKGYSIDLRILSSSSTGPCLLTCFTRHRL